MTGPVFIVDAIRTPFGRYGGVLAGTRPDDLAATVLKALLDRNPGLDPSRVDDVWFGNANGAGEENRNVARMAVLLAGMATSVPASTVNRLCGSGLEAVFGASRALAVGDAAVAVAGGVESMSRAPWVMPKPQTPYPRGHETMHSTTLGWRMVNPRMPEQWTVSLGESAQMLADRYKISREDQDEFAVTSHLNAAKAWADGVYDDEIAQVEGAELERDETIRPGASTESLARLKPAFRSDGSVTAGNSSPLNDGAAALLLTDETGLAVVGGDPIARVVSRASSGVDPDVFGIGPVQAARDALTRAGITWSDLRAVELNEAFACQSLACLAEWPDLDRSIVNVNGGAVAIGHPLGASGARIAASLARQLQRQGGGYGLAAICIGVGQGLALVLHA